MRLKWAVLAVPVLAAGLFLWKPWAASAPSAYAHAPSPELAQARKAQSSEMMDRARRLIAERGVKPENLSEAIGLLASARELLRPQAEHDPAPYIAAGEAYQEAVRLKDRMVEDLWVEYERLRHLEDFKGAQAVLRQVLRAAPRTDDPANAKARHELARWMASPD